MIDFHSHILPCLDDGSGSVEESRRLLAALAAQGVTKVVATPHFYADRESVPRFLERRSQAFCLLKEGGMEGLPAVILGAEVRYYNGIGRLETLPSLCMEKSRVLLLEMPFVRWTESVVKEACSLASRGAVTVVLAHVERYLAMQPPEVWERLSQSGAYFQANAPFFIRLRTRRKALRLLEQGRIQLLGSDCHNLVNRPPQMGKAVAVIRRKWGDAFVRDMMDYGESLFH